MKRAAEECPRTTVARKGRGILLIGGTVGCDKLAGVWRVLSTSVTASAGTPECSGNRNEQTMSGTRESHTAIWCAGARLRTFHPWQPYAGELVTPYKNSALPRESEEETESAATESSSDAEEETDDEQKPDKSDQEETKN